MSTKCCLDQMDHPVDGYDLTFSHLQFRKEEDAEKAVKDLNNRWFGGRPIYAELSPVTDFREACCRQYEMGECTRSGFCNFMPLKPISRELRRGLYGRTGGGGSGGGYHKSNRREGERSPPRRGGGGRDRDNDRRGGGGRDRDRDRGRHGRY